MWPWLQYFLPDILGKAGVAVPGLEHLLDPLPAQSGTDSPGWPTCPPGDTAFCIPLLSSQLCPAPPAAQSTLTHSKLPSGTKEGRTCLTAPPRPALAELAATMEMLHICDAQYSSHEPHVATGHLTGASATEGLSF